MGIHGIAAQGPCRDRVRQLLELVGLNPDPSTATPTNSPAGTATDRDCARPDVKPDIIICDESVSALDVSVQAQVLNLLEDLQDEFNLSYIFISHDLSVVRYIADRVAVTYLGKIVEEGVESDLYGNPSHPYTQALMSAVPVPDPSFRAQDAHPPPRRCAVGSQPSFRMPFPHPMLEGPGHLRRGRAPAGATFRHPGCLPFRRPA